MEELKLDGCPRQCGTKALNRVIGALEAARHELTVMHGLVAYDAATPSEKWVINTNKTVDMIDQVLRSLEEEAEKA